ncbi:MAG: response regulator transcription factor [Acidimicrobiia bacterium]|nr:response regulator transcription factor [Acidimicrobiia bacterium]
MALRIVLAEDSYLMREGIGSLLELDDQLELVASCEDPDELMAAVEEYTPDVVITDIRMPPTQTDEGIQAARRIRTEHPDIGVVVLSQYVEPAYALKLFTGGSDGLAYLLKERVGDLGELTNAIAQVAAGNSVIDPKVVEALIEARIRQESSMLGRLTERELEVLAKMAEGGTNAAIADALFISPRSVEKHINAIFTKLDLPPKDEVHRRVAAVLLFLGETDG